MIDNDIAPVPVQAPCRTFTGLLRSFLHIVIIDPVRSGRPQDRGWPYGLRAVVVVSAVLYLLGAVVVIIAGAVRGRLPLAVIPGEQAAVPRPLVMAVLIMIVGVLTLVFCAGLHGPWWLRVLGIVTTWLVLGSWGLHVQTTLIFRLVPVLVVIMMLALVGLAIARARSRFAWWEYPLVFMLIGLALVLAVTADSYGAGGFGVDLVGQALLQNVSVLGILAVPALFAAGIAVAELGVNATGTAARLVLRARRRRWIYLLLVVVVSLRIVLLVRAVIDWDRVEIGPQALLASMITMMLLAGALLVIGRIRRRSTDRVEVSAMPELANRLGLPVGAGLIAAYVPVVFLTFGATVLVALAPNDRAGWQTTTVLRWIGSDQPVTLFRSLLGVIIFVLAVRSARRGRSARGLLMATLSVLLISGLISLLPGLDHEPGFRPPVMAAVFGIGVLIMIVIDLLRGRMTADRAAAFTIALVLSILIADRDFVSDPVGVILGYSGVGLALFGLTWDLLTGSAWANGDSRRWPQPTRLLLILANSLFALVVLAVGALARVLPSAVPDADQWSGLGDWFAGSALVIAALVLTVTRSHATSLH